MRKLTLSTITAMAVVLSVLATSGLAQDADDGRVQPRPRPVPLGKAAPSRSRKQVSAASRNAYGCILRLFQDAKIPCACGAPVNFAHTIIAKFNLKNGDDQCQAECLVYVFDATPIVIFRSQVDFTIAEERRAAVAEYVTRANLGQPSGNFVLRYETGQLRYKCGLDLADGDLTPAMARSLLVTGLSQIERHLPGIMEVVRGQAPQRALAKVKRAKSRAFDLAHSIVPATVTPISDQPGESQVPSSSASQTVALSAEEIRKIRQEAAEEAKSQAALTPAEMAKFREEAKKEAVLSPEEIAKIRKEAEEEVKKLRAGGP